MDDSSTQHTTVLFTTDRPFYASSDRSYRTFVPFHTCTPLDDGLGASVPKSSAEKKEKAKNAISVSGNTTIGLYVHTQATTPLIGVQCAQSLFREKSKKASFVSSQPIGNFSAPFFHVIPLPRIAISGRLASFKTLYLHVKLVDANGATVLEMCRCLVVSKADVATADSELTTAVEAMKSTGSANPLLDDFDTILQRPLVAGPILLFRGHGKEASAPLPGAVEVQSETPPDKHKPGDWTPRSREVKRAGTSADGAGDGAGSDAKAAPWNVAVLVATREDGAASKSPSPPNLVLGVEKPVTLHRSLLYSREQAGAGGDCTVHLWRFDASFERRVSTTEIRYAVQVNGRETSLEKKHVLRIPAASAPARAAATTVTSPFGGSADGHGGDERADHLYENQRASLAHLYKRHIRAPVDLLMLDVSTLYTHAGDAHEVVRRLYPCVELARTQNALAVPETMDWRVSGVARTQNIAKNTWFHRFYANLALGEAEKARAEAIMFDLFIHRFAEQHMQNLTGAIPVVPYLPLDADVLPRENRNVLLKAMVKCMALFTIGRHIDAESVVNSRLEYVEPLCFPRLHVTDEASIEEAIACCPDGIKPTEADASTCGFLSFCAGETAPQLKAISVYGNHELALAQMRACVQATDPPPTHLLPMPPAGCTFVVGFFDPPTPEDLDSAWNPHPVLSKLLPKDQDALVLRLSLLRCLMRVAKEGGRVMGIGAFGPLHYEPVEQPFRSCAITFDHEKANKALEEAAEAAAAAAAAADGRRATKPKQHPSFARELCGAGVECVSVPLHFETDDSVVPPSRTDDQLIQNLAAAATGTVEDDMSPRADEEGPLAAAEEAQGREVDGEKSAGEACESADTSAASEASRSASLEPPANGGDAAAVAEKSPKRSKKPKKKSKAKRTGSQKQIDTDGTSGTESASEPRLADGEECDSASGEGEQSDKGDRGGGKASDGAATPDEGSAADASEKALANGDVGRKGSGEAATSAAGGTKRRRRPSEEFDCNPDHLRNLDTAELPPSPTVVHELEPVLVVLPHKTQFNPPPGDRCWNAPEAGSWNIVYNSTPLRPYDIRAASLSQLVDALTATPGNIKEMDTYDKFLALFFMTYRAFADPLMILNLIIERYYSPCWADSAVQERMCPPMSRIRHAVCKALVHWFTEHYHDFTFNRPLLHRLRTFIHIESRAHDAAQADDKQAEVDERSSIPVLRGMVLKKEKRGTYESMYDPSVIVENPLEPILPEKGITKETTFMMLNDVEIARQLTIAEFHIYVQIKPVEMQNLAWSKPKLKHTAPNILHLINHFNTFSMQCVTMIVQASTLKERKMVIEKLVSIADHLMELRSYNMAMAIKAAFNHASVHRLKYSFQGLPKATVKMANRLHEALSTENNNAAIRATVSKAVSPCIPFLGIYLSDLTFVEDGNPDYIHNGLINFRKRELEYFVIRQILAFKDRTYSLKLVPKITAIIDKLPVLDDKEIQKLSLKLEPRKAQKKDIK